MNGMSDEAANPPRASKLRIVGAILLVLGILWVALPLGLRWFLAGPGMTKSIPRASEIIVSPWLDMGLIIILFGLGFLDIVRRAWLPVAIVALVVWAVALSLRPFG